MKSIQVENVSKRFMLHRARPKNLAEGVRSAFTRGKKQEFWALKDIDFSVEEGGSLGIIGHNGAGKSTMLKLLTNILEPTSGRIRTRGRVSALIEIGAGFHPEMTGRENVFLNGSILGMTKREIEKKFDDIIGFAELERFVDTPVKRYSSGMYARLGFAVAAHVEPEILLVDEVLSVGDEAFQVKCQERMSGLMKGGATVVFVSHNFPAVVALCSRCLVIHRGQLSFDGPTVEAVRHVRKLQQADPELPRASVNESNDLPVQINRVRILDEKDREIEELQSGAPVTVEILCTARRDMQGLNFGVELVRADGVKAYDVNSRMDDYLPDVQAGNFVLRFHIPECSLTDGVYSISAGIMDRDEHIHYHTWTRCAYFTVIDNKNYRGIARLGHNWSVMTEPAAQTTEHDIVL